MSTREPESSKSVREYSDPIAVDLLINIFSRLPAKSIGRFRCVSKLWRSILVRSNFTELFLTKSLTRPRLFFSLTSYSDLREKSLYKELLFYSSPQPQNLDGSSSFVVATRYDPPYQYDFHDTFTPLCGMVLCQKFFKTVVRVIRNPATGESITLPSVKGKFKHISFGYDPINKQFKVLCVASPDSKRPSQQILTLKTGKRKWRRIECKPHKPLYNTTSVCINGVLYYSAKTKESFVIVCFDVRSEKFGFINIDTNMLPGTQWYLVNYKGKLGAQIHRLHRRCSFKGGKFVMWVLEDAENHEWSKHVYIMPPLWKNLGSKMKNVGMTRTGELVLTPFLLSKLFYVYFYNLERNIITRVDVQFQGIKGKGVVNTFIDYTENIQGLR